MLWCFEDGLSSAESLHICLHLHTAYLDSCLVAGVLSVGEHGLGSGAVLLAAYRHVIMHGM